jgi:hypothetical protein
MGVVACVGDEPGLAPSSPNDAGGGSDASETTDGGQDASNDAGLDGADSNAGSFCAQHPGTALCEDFETKSFPPGGWLTEKSGANTIDVAAGFESARGFAAYHDSTTSALDALFYRDDVAVAANHTKIRFSARVRVMTYGAPASFTTLLYLRVGDAPQRFISLVMRSAGIAEVLDDDTLSSPVDITLPSFALGTWHAFAMELARGATTTMTVTLDGVAGTPVSIAAIGNGAKRVAIGLQSGANSGSRRLELDDVLVALE